MASTDSYLSHLSRDAPFHAFVTAYCVVGFLFAVAVGAPHKFAPFSYLGFVGQPGLFLSIVIGAGLWSLSTPSPFFALRRGITAAKEPRVAASFLLLINLSVFVGVFTSIKTILNDVIPFFADQSLADMDRLLHGQKLWLYASAVMPAQMTPLLEAIYFGAWNLLLPGAMLAVLFVPGLQKIRAQYVWTFLIAWPLLGNVVAGLLMSAGPVYYDLVTGDSARFAALSHSIARYSVAREWAAYLWHTYVFGASGAGSGISAFPSMHLANATLFVLLAHRVRKSLMWAALAFCAMIQFGSVYLGWHYAVDGYFAIAATVIIWKGVAWALGPEQSPAAAVHPDRPESLDAVRLSRNS